MLDDPIDCSVDFSKDENRREMAYAIASAVEHLGTRYALLVGAERVPLPVTFDSRNPSAPAEVVGVFPLADAPTAVRALDAAAEGFAQWRSVPAGERAAALRRAADALLRRRFEFAAWLCFETGHTWREADAEVARAADLIRRNADEAEALGAYAAAGPKQAEQAAPMGAGAALTPTAAPLEAPAAIASAALAAGNALVLKPARQASTIAWKLVEAFRNEGVPPAALNLLTGSGEELARPLFDHPACAFFAYLGRGETHDLLRAELDWMPAVRAGRPLRWMQTGKTTLLVEKGAPLEEVAATAVAAAFFRSGSAAGACAEVVAVEEAYGEIEQRVVALARERTAGPAIDLETRMGPLPTAGHAAAMIEAVEACRRAGGRVLTGGEGPHEDQGQFVDATVVTDLPDSADVRQHLVAGPLLVLTRTPGVREFVETSRNLHRAGEGLRTLWGPGEQRLPGPLHRHPGPGGLTPNASAAVSLSSHLRYRKEATRDFLPWDEHPYRAASYTQHARRPPE